MIRFPELELRGVDGKEGKPATAEAFEGKGLACKGFNGQGPPVGIHKWTWPLGLAGGGRTGDG